MLIAGIYGKSAHAEFKGYSDTEYKTLFALWCMAGSPLIIGCDIRSVNDFTHKLLQNKALIALNQNIECCPPYPVSGVYGSLGVECPTLIRHLSDGSFAVGYFNLSDETKLCKFAFADAGIPRNSGLGFEMQDMFTGEHIGIKRYFYNLTLQPHDCAVFKARLIKLR